MEQTEKPTMHGCSRDYVKQTTLVPQFFQIRHEISATIDRSNNVSTSAHWEQLEDLFVVDLMTLSVSQTSVECLDDSD
jgi:hypothetical protein